VDSITTFRVAAELLAAINFPPHIPIKNLPSPLLLHHLLLTNPRLTPRTPLFRGCTAA